MLKTTRLFGSAPAEDEVVRGGDGKADKTVKNLSKSKKPKNDESKNLTHIPTIGATRESTFLTSGVRKTFNHLRQVFNKAPILRNFNLEYHIQIKTDALSYAIGKILSLLSFDWVALDGSNLTKSNFG